jgi:hypothetical protein
MPYKDKEKQKEYYKNYDLKRKDKRKQEYYENQEENIKKVIEYNKEHAVERAIYMKKYFEEHKKEKDEYDKEYYKNNKDKINKRRREHTKNNRDRENDYWNKYNRNIKITDIIDKKQLLEKFNNICIWCKIFEEGQLILKNDKTTHMDHLISVATYKRINKKCPHSWNNVVPSCIRHNTQKRDKLPLNYIWDKIKGE